MTTEEHLNKIIAKCRELLAGAEKRTQYFIKGLKHDKARDLMNEEDIEFGLSCAGPAEAGWRATIGMCEQALSVLQFHSERPSSPTQLAELETIEFFAETLIAAWPEELL